MAGRITVIGSANVDFIFQLPRLPQKGESVTGTSFSQSFGGKGSNQAIAARRAGAEVTAILNLGGDGYALSLLETHRKEGIDTTHIVVNAGQLCGAGLIMVDPNGDNAIATAVGANDLFSADQVERAEEAIANSDLLMLQMEIPDAPIRRAIELANKHGVEVMLNYAPVRSTSIRLDASVGILVVNETEAEAVAGMAVATPQDAEKAAAKLAEAGHRLVIVTLGANGCLAFENKQGMQYPAFPVAAVDTTGAGDSFCGALGAALVEGRTLAGAIRFAPAAGALCVCTMGAMPSIPTRRRIETFLNTHYTG